MSLFNVFDISSSAIAAQSERLNTVASNIALSKLLHHPSAHQWGLFDGVRVLKKEASSDRPSRLVLLHASLFSAAER